MTIRIPEKIKVGYRTRSDTYTGKLAYVIYVDEKGKLRKETSWNSWRDKNIEPDDFVNEPTEGFVLNKKAGGYSTGWNHRQSYIRVYDPRGFEFEITPENLLYILENATSTKGKGLEGTFVYGWSGKDLILISTDAPDYKELDKLKELRYADKRYIGKDMKLGATYLTKDGEHYVYLGRFMEYTTSWNYPFVSTEVGKKYFFYQVKNSGYELQTVRTLSTVIVDTVSEECVANYAELMDKLEHESFYSPFDGRVKFIPFTEEQVSEIEERASGYLYSFDYNCIQLHFNGEYKEVRICKEVQSTSTGKKVYYYITNRSYSYSRKYNPNYGEANTVQELVEKYNLGLVQHYLQNGNLHKTTGAKL